MILGVATVVVVGAAVVINSLWPRDRARAVDTSVVVERFRTSTSATEPPSTAADPDLTDATDGTNAADAATTPAPGVYVYRTTGTESVDLLGGATHQYPERSTVTVTVGGCGVSLRWDLLVERYDEWGLCVGGDGIELAPYGGDYHEFFGTGRHQRQVCTGPLLVVPADGRPRPPQRWDCTFAGRLWNPAVEVLEQRTFQIGDDSVVATHVRTTLDIEGHYFDRALLDWWLDPHGLPVSMQVSRSSRTDSGVIGDVVYTEQVQVELESLVPLT